MPMRTVRHQLHGMIDYNACLFQRYMDNGCAGNSPITYLRK